MIVGDTGGGSLTIDSSGVVNAGSNGVDVGYQSGSSGTVSVDDGTLIAGAVSVEIRSTAVLPEH